MYLFFTYERLKLPALLANLLPALRVKLLVIPKLPARRAKLIPPQLPTLRASLGNT